MIQSLHFRFRCLSSTKTRKLIVPFSSFSFLFTINYVGFCQNTNWQHANHTVSEERGGDYCAMASCQGVFLRFSCMFPSSPDTSSWVSVVFKRSARLNDWIPSFPIALSIAHKSVPCLTVLSIVFIHSLFRMSFFKAVFTFNPTLIPLIPSLPSWLSVYDNGFICHSFVKALLVSHSRDSSLSVVFVFSISPTATPPLPILLSVSKFQREKHSKMFPFQFHMLVTYLKWWVPRFLCLSSILHTILLSLLLQSCYLFIPKW